LKSIESEIDCTLKMTTEVSFSGRRLYPLTKGLYATVSEWLGEPKVHIRAFVPPVTNTAGQAGEQKQEGQFSNGENSNSSSGSNNGRPTRLVATKRGVCLDEEGFEQLLALQYSIREEVAALKQELGSMASGDEASSGPGSSGAWFPPDWQTRGSGGSPVGLPMKKRRVALDRQ
jgi:hypothetical protein